MPWFTSCNHLNLMINARHQANLCVLVYTTTAEYIFIKHRTNAKHKKRIDHIYFQNERSVVKEIIEACRKWVYFNQTRHSSFIWYVHIYLNDFQGERSRLRQIWDKKQDVLCINCQWDYVPSQIKHTPIFSKNFMLIWNIINMIKYINRLNLYINLKQILHFSNTIDILQSL